MVGLSETDSIVHVIIETLIRSFRNTCEQFPDKRTGNNISYGMGDIGLTAFSVFFMQSPSFLANQRLLETGRGKSNCQSLFKIDKIPTDNHIRNMIDPAEPSLLFPYVLAKPLNCLKNIKRWGIFNASVDTF